MAATATWRRNWLFRAAIGTVFALGAGLTLDYAWCDSETVIKRNMKRRLLACERPPTVPALLEPMVRLETGQPAPELSFLVNVLLGPTGCGKSTVLKDLARAYLLAGVPTFLIGFRVPMRDDRPKGPLSASEAVELMDATARQVYSQVGFPARRSILGTVAEAFVATAEGVKVIFKVLAGKLEAEAEATVKLSSSGSRLMTCFTYLFDVAKEVARERQATGVMQLAAAPVLLFDELEDLTKDSRLKKAGGQFVLDHLSCLLVNSGVDNKLVRNCIAGSSAKLVFALASPAKGFRLSYFYLADPTREAMLEALAGRNYSTSDAVRMVDLCGTRLRLFDGPLIKTTALPAAVFIAEAIRTAKGDFGSVEGALSDADIRRSLPRY